MLILRKLLNNWTNLKQTTENHINNNDKHFQIGEREQYKNYRDIYGLGADAMAVVSDFNLITKSGFYHPKGANSPTSDVNMSVYLIVIGLAQNAVLQIAQPYQSQLGTQLYKRTNAAGIWSNWMRILTQDDYDQLFTLFSSFKTKIASATTDKGVPTNADATGDQMATNIRAIPTSPNVVKGSFTVPAMSPGQTVSVDTASFAITPNNAYCSVVGTVRINGNNIGTILSGVVYCANIGVMGTFGNQYLQFVITNNTSQYYSATTQNYVITQ